MLLSTFTCVPHLLSFAFFVRLFGSLLFTCDNYVLVNYFNFLMPSFSQLLSQCYLITDFLKYFTIKWKEESVLKCSLLPTEYFWVRAPDISSSVLYLGYFQHFLSLRRSFSVFQSIKEQTFPLQLFLSTLHTITHVESKVTAPDQGQWPTLTLLSQLQEVCPEFDQLLWKCMKLNAKRATEIDLFIHYMAKIAS